MAMTPDERGDAWVLFACVFAFSVLLLGIIVGLPWLAKKERAACVERALHNRLLTLSQAERLCE